MLVSEIKEELHKAIDKIENKELLQAMLIILAQGKFSQEGYQFTEEQLNVLREREERYLAGENKTQTLDEFKAKMNKKYGI